MEAKLRSGWPRGDVREDEPSGWKTERERRRETCSRAASSDSNERMRGRGLRLLRGGGGWRWGGCGRRWGDLDGDGRGDGGDGFAFRGVRVDDWLGGFGGADEFDLVLEEGVAANEWGAAGFAKAEGRWDEERGFGA